MLFLHLNTENDIGIISIYSINQPNKLIIN